MVTTNLITLVTDNPTTPAVITQPLSVTASAGGTANFFVAGSGGALTYQWLKNGAAISGATGANYTISTVSTTSAGNYSVVLTNSAGTVTSNAATLTVTSLSAPVFYGSADKSDHRKRDDRGV